MNVTDAGEPDRACETVTVADGTTVTSATVVPLATEVPVTSIPTVTPVVWAKYNTRSGSFGVPVVLKSMVVADALVVSGKEKAGGDVGSPLAD